MSDPSPPNEAEGRPASATPRARASRPLWPGLVWAIPLAALLVVLFLGIRALVDHGVDAVITFDTAPNVKVGDTKVMFQGYEVGHVVKIDVGTNVHHIDVTVRLDKRAGPILRTGTVFWLIGGNASLTDLSAVKAVFSGPAIGVAPSFEGRPTRRFRGLGEEPVVLPGASGTAFVLDAASLGSLKRRSSVGYRGQEVGKVTGTAMTAPGHFRIDLFVNAPYDRLVRPGMLFWPSSALKLAIGSGGVSAQIDDPAALLAGGVQMDVAPEAPPTPSPAGAHFFLADSRDAALGGAPGPRVPYTVTFSAPAGDLAEGSQVTMLGFPVGAVLSRSLAYDPSTGHPYTRVTVGLEPGRLRGGDPLPQADDPASLRRTTDGLVSRLLAQGYRVRLVQTPPVIGGRSLTLERVAGAGPAALSGGDPPQIPSAISGDLAAQASDILAKVDHIPIEQMGQDVAAITRRLRALTASPDLDESLHHLRNTLAQADKITTEAEPQVGPLVAKLRNAADEAAGAAGAARTVLTGEGGDPDASLPHAIQELGDAATSLRALADGLARHPESLLRGKGKPSK